MELLQPNHSRGMTTKVAARIKARQNKAVEVGEIYKAGRDMLTLDPENLRETVCGGDHGKFLNLVESVFGKQ